MTILPCLDSPELALQRKRDLDIPRNRAAALGESAVEAVKRGWYLNPVGERVDLTHFVERACARKVSIAPNTALPRHEATPHYNTTVQVTNETTLGAAKRMVDRKLRPVALNFANGVHPGGGFLTGARAQEESICRSSALFSTLVEDPMYEEHRKRPLPDSTDWAIYSPDVPVFRMDRGDELAEPWLLSFITCAAPYAPAIGQAKARELLRHRIHRVLAIAQAYEYSELVLGAWGCGAFGNDTAGVACDFRDAFENEFQGVFPHVVFAITDWSPERKFLGPFCGMFPPGRTC